MIVGDAGLMLPLPAVTENVTLTPETGLPWLSVTRTDGAATDAPTVAEAGCVLAALIFVAAPTVMLNAKLVAPVTPVAVVLSVYPVPALSIETAENVATPDTGVTAPPPVSVPPPALFAMARET